MKKYLGILFLAFTCFLFSETVNSYIEMGDGYFKKGDYDNAILVYREGLKKFPDNEELLDRIETSEIEKSGGQRPVSENAAEETPAAVHEPVKKIEPVTGDKSEILQLAKNAENNKDYSGAIAYYKKYMKMDGNKDPEAIYGLGNIYFKISLFEYAMNTFDLDKSGDYRNIFGSALTARFLGFYSKAIENYKKVLNQKPNMKEAVLGLGISYQLSGDFDNALAYFKKYLSQNKDEDVYIGAINIAIKKKKYEQAKDFVDRGITVFPDSTKLRELAAEVYRRAGK